MPSVERFQQYFNYHYAMMDQIWDSVAVLSKDQYHQHIAYSRGSVHEQILHIVATDQAWLQGIHGLPRKPRLDPADYADYESTRILYGEVKTAFMAYIHALTEVELDRVPERFYGPVWQVLSHVVNHGTDHRAQILRILQDLGALTFEQDFILWLWRT